MQQEEQKQAREEYERLRNHSEKTKKKLVILVLCLAGAIAIFITSLVIMRACSAKQGGKQDFDFNFFPTYQGDIMQFEEYLQKDRLIQYCADPLGYGLTVSIGEENRAEFDDTVLFLCDYLQTVIAGDADAYNQLFSEAYIEKNGRKSDFSPQMLHDMKITYLAMEAEGREARLTYQLEYRIYRNDGSFRNDVESDKIRPQKIVLYRYADGTIEIEDLITAYGKK